MENNPLLKDFKNHPAKFDGWFFFENKICLFLQEKKL